MTTVTKSFSLLSGGLVQTWLAPAGVNSVSVIGYSTPVRNHASNNSATHRAMVNAAGDAYTWGNNAAGYLGDGTIVSKSSPIAVIGGIKFTQVVTGGFHTLGLDQNGRAWAWGTNANGQLGDGTIVAKSSPVAVIGGFIFKSLSAGATWSHGVTLDGRGFGWGNGTLGQLGDGTIVPKSSPVLVVGNLRFIHIAASTSASIGLTENGAAYCWGQNLSGELGDGTVLSKSSPVAVQGGLTFMRVSTGGSSGTQHMAGITTAGAAYCWGSNSSGMLGDATIVDKSSPVAVVGGIVFKNIQAGINQTQGLDTSGNMYCWGGNPKGELGDGTGGVGNMKSSPVLVVGALVFNSIGPNTSSSLSGLTASGALYCWGDAVNGQLGDSTIVAKSSPVLVVGSIIFTESNRTYKNSLPVAVTPGTTYNLDFTRSHFTFNNVYIGLDVYRVDLVYFA